jgi:hypothetical protein
MDQIRAVFNSLAAWLLLRLAVVTIRLMQWLYNRQLIDQQPTDQFFRTAKRLEQLADKLSARTRKLR